MRAPPTAWTSTRAPTLAYAVLTVGGARNLYSINLAATASPATSLGALGVTEDIRGIALRPAAAPVAYGLTDDGRLLAFKTGHARTPSTPAWRSPA